MGGFSLIETIAAFTIGASIMVLFFELFARNLQGIGNSTDYTRAVVLAESRLDRLGISEPILPGITSGKVDDRFTWEVRVGPPERTDAARAVVPLRVYVRVSWPGATARRSVLLESVRLGGIR